VLESDSALSARLLRLVNSAGYALRVRCTSVRHAAALVGIEKLHQVSTTAAILDLFDSQTAHAARILEHGTIVAALSRYLAAHLSLPTDDLFTAGFLHDIGKLMLLETEGAAYSELLDVHGGRFDSLHRAERERYGFDHAVLGAHVLAAWNIPQPIPRLVAWHHQLGRAYEAGTRWCALICALRLADQLAYNLDAEEPHLAIENVAQGEAARFLDISEPQLDAMWHELRTLMLRSRAVFRGEEPPAPEPVPSRSGRLRKPDDGPAQEPRVPKSFPCVVCEGPSFGNRCQACGGHVCPVHELAPDSWCTLCVEDWHAHVEGSRTSLAQKLVLGSGSLLLAALAGFGASQGQTASGLSVGIGSMLALAFSWTVVLVGGRWWRRTSFLRQRPNREQSEARRVAHEHDQQAAESASEDLSAAVDAVLPELLAEERMLEASGVGPASIPGPSISFAPASEDALPEDLEDRISATGPTISFAPVSNDSFSEVEDRHSIPSLLPDVEPGAAADSERPASKVSLSTPKLNVPSFPSLPPLDLGDSSPTSSLTLGASSRLSVTPPPASRREDCKPSSRLDAACSHELLIGCRANEASCSALPEDQGWTLEPVPSRPTSSRLDLGQTDDLRHAC
ncbi:MAG: HDOD domain-containing protein, partial [Myxococcales bacterium]|nr:HDOD domain-containing protein [Myxococcales bacterium]